MGYGTIKLMRPNIDEEECFEHVKEVLRSGYLVEGNKVREFETTVAEYTGAKHAIACTSATTALELALRCLGVGKGDEVIVPDFTHPATALVVQTVLAEPVLVDVDIDTCNTDKDKIEQAITEKTKAIIPVSIFGHPLDIDPINKLKEKYNINIIDDAACSLGSEYKGDPVGGLTDISVFSFHPRKVFTCGDGGLITTNNDDWADSIRSMKIFGIGKTDDGKSDFVNWGTNYRMSNIHGAVLLGQVKRIDEIVNDRVKKARLYDNLLRDINDIKVPQIESYAKSNYQTYTVYIKNGKRDYLLKEMKERGIEVQIGTYALHKLPVFKNVKKRGSLSNSRSLYNDLLALPLHAKLSEDNQKYVVKTLQQLI